MKNECVTCEADTVEVCSCFVEVIKLGTAQHIQYNNYTKEQFSDGKEAHYNDC